MNICAPSPFHQMSQIGVKPRKDLRAGCGAHQLICYENAGKNATDYDGDESTGRRPPFAHNSEYDRRCNSRNRAYPLQ